jgi:hypothetical protein
MDHSTSAIGAFVGLLGVLSGAGAFRAREAWTAAEAPELHAQALGAEAALELAQVSERLDAVAAATGAELRYLDCGAPPCVAHLSWPDDEHLQREAAAEAALRHPRWTLRGQVTLAPEGQAWRSHYAVAVWPRRAEVGQEEHRRATERLRGLLRGAVGQGR